MPLMSPLPSPFESANDCTKISYVTPRGQALTRGAGCASNAPPMVSAMICSPPRERRDEFVFFFKRIPALPSRATMLARRSKPIRRPDRITRPVELVVAHEPRVVVVIGDHGLVVQVMALEKER